MRYYKLDFLGLQKQQKKVKMVLAFYWWAIPDVNLINFKIVANFC